MSKMNAFGSFIGEHVTASVPLTSKPEPKQTTAAKRSVGRPRKAIKPDVQTTTIRMDPADHTAVRTLALRDKVAMNDLVFTALKEYCKKRGVLLAGAYK
jgi:predicted HicB family RNase H-like nuclease